jgi:hypothetical protein
MTVIQKGGIGMKQGSIIMLLAIGMLFVATAGLQAEVKTEEKNQFKMEGFMGRMMGMFGGKAAKEGVVNTVATKGNRKITRSEDTGEIIDLDEQKIYSINYQKKVYQVITFEEMRRRLQKTQEEAAKAAKENNESQPSEKQMEFDFSIKDSGQKRTINGYDCREVIMIITAREKGKTLEAGGGMVMTSHIWIGPKIPALNEIIDFEQRYAKALGNVTGLGGSAEQMAMATAMFPAMKDMIGKMQVESVNMEGSQILTEMTMETVKSAEQMAQAPKQASESSNVTSIGGLGGMLGRRLGRKKEADADPNKPQNRSTFLTVNHELLKIVTSVLPEDMAIPAGFKEKK